MSFILYSTVNELKQTDAQGNPIRRVKVIERSASQQPVHDFLLG